MPYNIDNVEAKVLDAWIKAVDVMQLLQYKDLPENCFLRDMKKAAYKALAADKPYAHISLPNFWWAGERSGTSWPLLDGIASFIYGHVEAIITWEGGDDVTGIIIKDGVLVECDVVQTLVPRVKA
jgi:hypothetical protein